MGLLLKEALKCLCGENQWSYAVFWKIGYNNPSVLVWEEHYYEPDRHSTLQAISGIESTDLLLKEWEGLWNSSDQNHIPRLGCQVEDKVLMLINKMMMNSQIHVVGEGIVGRVAFMGMHQWILQENSMLEGYPSEVLAEVQHQFLAGMQTIAVIPVLPHGVVQLGSKLAVVENTGFVSNVKGLFAQLASIPGSLLSDAYTRKDLAPEIGSSVSLGVPLSADLSRNFSSQAAICSPFMGAGFDQQNSAFQASEYESCPSGSLAAQIQGNLQMQRNCSLNPTTSNYQTDFFRTETSLPSYPYRRDVESREIGAQVILSSADARLNKPTRPNDSSIGSNNHLIGASSSSSGVPFNGHQILSGTRLHEHISNTLPTSENSGKSQPKSNRNDLRKRTSVPLSHSNTSGSAETNSRFRPQIANDQNWSNSSDVLPGTPIISRLPINDDHIQRKWTGKQIVENDLFQAYNILSANLGDQIPGVCNSFSEDDLFGILGLDQKTEKRSGSWNGSLTKNDVSKCITTDSGSDLYPMNDGISESGIFSETASDHLLDAVVSNVHPSSRQVIDDEMSCWTTLTKASSSSVPAASLSRGQVRMPDQKQQKNYGFPLSHLRTQTAGPSSYNSGCISDNGGETSQISSMYGSQISLALEDSQNLKCDTSVSTAHSKRPHETGKPNRKKLKPGESPRPRPKDRQMIQDRVKELREIVPNGAKCSIDALLERTIKHMLFLQSVTKHADKLKQTGESKIISKEGSLLKDNFDGGATWAFEVGSQSMVCPIIVEDLNQPRQMLVEMLCEERGFFLEIADIIRGLGLTILKGVMEARNDKVWVRFMVEANRDVTRMEIFLSLVHLLEQAMKGSIVSSQGISGGKIIARDTSHQAFVPTAGQSNSFQ